ncbi:MAG: hypothetical protein GQ564_19160 [Bacteroidales bacterium]|nr:hypothetical protein [Bacteroidales bacterium]
MKNIVLIFSIFFILNACEKDEPMENVQNIIHISYTNSIGDDLLDENTVNHIDPSNIDIYYLSEGAKIRVYDENMDLPESFKIYFNQTYNKYFLQIQLSHFVIDNLSETYIHINEDVDTIKCEYEIIDNGYSFQKVWYNSILKINSDNWIEFIEITK